MKNYDIMKANFETKMMVCPICGYQHKFEFPKETYKCKNGCSELEVSKIDPLDIPTSKD